MENKEKFICEQFSLDDLKKFMTKTNKIETKYECKIV